LTTSFSLVTRGGHPDFLDLPWSRPLERWDHPRLVHMARGVSRHVVRFVAYDDRVYALKETTEELARREFRTLRDMAQLNLPVVEAVGVVTDRVDDGGTPLDAMLITAFLEYSLPYRYLLTLSTGPEIRPKLVDAGALLLVRLHLDGAFWGDCSLSNVLFRRDAGAMAAYLVDAETTELSPAPLGDGLRDHDLDIATENVFGGLVDLQAAGQVRTDLDPLDVVTELRTRYEDLWAELTRTDEVPASDRHLIEQRVRRLQELGFDVEELAVDATGRGDWLQVKPVVVEEGHHARELRRRTGLEVQENQARRLLGDIAAFRAWLEHTEGRPISEAVAAARWMVEVYEPLLAQVPADLWTRREPAELFHELLEHRWFLAEQAGAEVTNEAALASYLEGVLPARPPERTLLDGETPPP
jgi:hypothetical protein